MPGMPEVGGWMNPKFRALHKSASLDCCNRFWGVFNYINLNLTMWIQICIYIYVCLYICIYTPHIYIYVYTYSHICIDVYIYIRTLYIYIERERVGESCIRHAYYMAWRRTPDRDEKEVARSSFAIRTDQKSRDRLRKASGKRTKGNPPAPSMIASETLLSKIGVPSQSQTRGLRFQIIKCTI